jgi:hypothetical protein
MGYSEVLAGQAPLETCGVNISTTAFNSNSRQGV